MMQSGASGSQPSHRAVCLGCSCLCDDIEVVMDGQNLVEAHRACALGRQWFLQTAPAGAPEARVSNRDVSLAVAIERAAELLCEARSPLVHGLSGATSRAVRLAVAIADRLGAFLDSDTSVWHQAALRSIQAVGQVTCTFGEIAGRCDLVIYWGGNPARDQPRHAERYTLEPCGTFVAGRSERTCIVIDSRETETFAWADQAIRIKSDSEFEACSILRALLRGIALDARQVEQQTGVALPTWNTIAARMKRAHYGALFYGERIAAQQSGHLAAEALSRLVIELNDFTRFVLLPLPAGANATGADEVLTWTTGYPFAVSFARGYPRYFACQYMGQRLLARRQVDAALLVGADVDQYLSPAAREHLAAIPRVAMHWRDEQPPRHGDVFIRVARPGVESAGTVYRGDGVPLPLHVVRMGRSPAAEHVLELLLDAVCRRLAVGDSRS
jgi:formylmethanofuran dehydrogenase subunit B